MPKIQRQVLVRQLRLSAQVQRLSDVLEFQDHLEISEYIRVHLILLKERYIRNHRHEYVAKWRRANLSRTLDP